MLSTARPAPNPAPALTPPASMGQRGTGFPGTSRPAFSGGLQERESGGDADGKEVVTMSTQRTFKRRVRARMAKTGESYTSARAQLLRKAEALPADPTAGHAAEPDDESAAVPDGSGRPAPASTDEAIDPTLLPTTEAAMRKATGRSYADWFRILDAWNGGQRTHTEIAAWLVGDQRVAGWWSQTITVGYERVRGLRAVHQTSTGFSVGANRTVAVEAERLLEAFLSEARQAGWLAGQSVTPRQTSLGLGIRFAWPDPPSKVAVFAAERGPGKATLSVQHERLPDAAAGRRLKTFWREQLDRLKASLEATPGR
jgi:hypothetical protein